MSMSPWVLLLVPLTLVAVSLLLAFTTWLEEQILSPRALILSAARARGGRTDQVEALVAEQCELLLGQRFLRADRASKSTWVNQQAVRPTLDPLHIEADATPRPRDGRVIGNATATRRSRRALRAPRDAG